MLLAAKKIMIIIKSLKIDLYFIGVNNYRACALTWSADIKIYWIERNFFT